MTLPIGPGWAVVSEREPYRLYWFTPPFDYRITITVAPVSIYSNDDFYLRIYNGPVRLSEERGSNQRLLVCWAHQLTFQDLDFFKSLQMESLL